MRNDVRLLLNLGSLPPPLSAQRDNMRNTQGRHMENDLYNGDSIG